MSQITQLGEADVTAYLKVEKKDGRVLYYKVENEETEEITEQEYLANNKE